MLKKITLPVFVFIMISAGKDSTISFNAKELERSLSYIPITGCYFPSPQFTPNDSSKIAPETFTQSAFYISKYEVSNAQYLIYVKELLINGKREDYTAALPDTSVWRQPLTFGEPYREYYFRHPAYRDYPVVGVTYEQSKKYCEWLTQKYASEIKKKFPKAIFKLPTVTQWYVAAQGGLDASVFPWGGPYVRNEKGEWLANFMVIADRCIYRDEKTNELKIDMSLRYGTELNTLNNSFADITSPVLSYWPNNYGLYNMAGNVEEFVAEKGITKGGSWKDPAYYLQNMVEEKYDTLKSASAERGFRFVMEIQK